MRLTAFHANAAAYHSRSLTSCVHSVARQTCRAVRATGHCVARHTSVPYVRRVHTAAGVGGLFASSSKTSQLAFSEAAAAAEAAQKALLTSTDSPLAPYLQDRPHLADLCKTYGGLQQLYHSKLQQQLQQWGGSMGNKPGSTVREYTKIVRRMMSERSGGWSMDLGVQVGPTAADRVTKLGEVLAEKLEQLVQAGFLPDRLDALVLPDLVTLITKGGSAAAGSCGDLLKLGVTIPDQAGAGGAGPPCGPCAATGGPPRAAARAA